MDIGNGISQANSHINASIAVKRVHNILLLTTILVTSGCAYNQAPVVDLAGVSKQQYETDRAYCEQFALQVDKDEAGRVGSANGAVTGAGSGAIMGALDNGVNGAVVGSLVGALIGGATGNAQGRIEATEDQARVLRNCLADKGYKVYDREV